MSHAVKVAENVHLFVEDIGVGKPIVFIHGWPLNHKMFEYQFNQLPQLGYRCIGIDLRGYGRSDKPWCEYTYDQFADDINIVLNALNLQDVTLCGFSMGGAIAVHYMAKYSGNRVKKLALLAAAAPVFTEREDYPYGTKKKEIDLLNAQCYRDRAKMLENFGKIFFYQKNALSSKLHDWFHGLGMEAMPHATVRSAIELRDRDLRAALPLISVPTAIFHGIADKICPFVFAEQLNKNIKNSTLICFEKSGHGLFWDEQEKLNQELMNFMG